MRKLFAIIVFFAVLFSGCLAVPKETHIYESSNGCTSTGICPWGGTEPRNFYYAWFNEIVIAPGQSDLRIAHELCHAHQDYKVNTELGIEPSIDLWQWYLTSEGQSFIILSQRHPHQWILSENVPLEDFAETCAWWLVYPESLEIIDPIRYKWANEWLGDGGY